MALPAGASTRDRWLDLADDARAKRQDALANGNHRMAGLWDEHERTLLRNAYDDVPFPSHANDDDRAPDTGLDAGDGAPEGGVQTAAADDDPSTVGEFLMAANEPRVTDPITVIGDPDEADQPQRRAPSTLSSTGAAAAIINRHEKRFLEKYQDPGGHWTVGTGHKLTDAEAARHPKAIDDAAADRLLAEDVAKAETNVRRLVKVPLSQNEFDALVSYTFNIGQGNLAKSRVLKMLNEGNYDGAAQLLPHSFVTSSGKELPGLKDRRREEQKLFQQR